MDACSWCEGKGVTGRLVRGEESEVLEVGGTPVTIANRRIPVLTLIDGPCGWCWGTGVAPKLVGSDRR